MGAMLITPWFVIGFLVWVFYDTCRSWHNANKDWDEIERQNKEMEEKIKNMPSYSHLTPEQQKEWIEKSKRRH